MWELGISSRQPGTKVKVEDDLSRDYFQELSLLVTNCCSWMQEGSPCHHAAMTFPQFHVLSRTTQLVKDRLLTGSFTLQTATSHAAPVFAARLHPLFVERSTQIGVTLESQTICIVLKDLKWRLILSP